MRRRARRALAMAWWARGGAAWPSRPPRRAISADSTTSPNSPATPREHSFGRSRPTRRPCVVLVGPAPCPSRRAPPPATRLAPRVRFVVFYTQLEFRCYPLAIPTRRARRRLDTLASTSVLVCGSEREVQLPAPAAGRDDAARRRHTTRSVTQGLVALTETDLRHGSGYNLLLYPLDASMDPTSDRGGDCGHRSKRGTP